MDWSKLVVLLPMFTMIGMVLYTGFIISRSNKKWRRESKVADLTLSHCMKLVNYRFSPGCRFTVAEHRACERASFDKIYNSIKAGKSPILLYPKKMRTKVYNIVYPRNGRDLMLWMKANHPEVIKEYQVSRRARERLFEDAA